MSLTEQTNAVKTAIQNAFASLTNKIDQDIADVNSLLASKVDEVAGKDLSEEDFTSVLLAKLDGIEEGATATPPTNLSITLAPDQITLISSSGTNAILPAATNTNAGLMDSSDKTKLIGIEAGAQVNPGTTAARNSSATDTVLQAKAMNDHTASGDHDGRYHTKSQVNSLLSDKLDAASVLDVLTSTNTSAALSANQGKVLKDEVDTINALLQSDTGTLDSLQEIVDFIQLNRADLDSLTISSIAGLQSALNDKVDAVSGKTLTSNDFTNALLSKLNGIEAGAEVNVATNLSQSRNATSYTVISSTGNDTTLAAATVSAAGIMTAADKAKLNAIATGANNYTHPGSSFSMAALSGAKVISDINVDSTGHISAVSTRNLSKGNVGLGNVPNVDATNASNLASGTVPAARLSGSYGISITGNAATATRLATARSINGVSFNGTSNITVYDNTKVSKSGDTINGDLTVTGMLYCDDWTMTSDERKKSDIEPLGPTLEDIRSIEGIRYRITDDERRQTRFGFSAQKMLNVFPELVRTDDEGFHSLVYTDAVAVVWGGLTELANALDSERSKFESERDRMQGEIDELKGLVHQLLEEQ